MAGGRIWFTIESRVDHKRGTRLFGEVVESQGEFREQKIDATTMSDVPVSSILGAEFAALW